MNVIREYGIDLFTETFKEAIRDEFVNTQYQASHVRIRLHMPSRLQALPWEIMHLPEEMHQTFLCLTTNLTLVRLRPAMTTGISIPLQLPLRILIIVSTPLDYAPVSARVEVNRLLQTLAGLIREGRAVVDFVQGADTSGGMLTKTRLSSYHIIHFIGHTGDASGPLRLIFEDRGRKSKAITARRLVQHFAASNLPSVVLLNTCEAAASSVITPLTGIAENLLELGVSVVIAHQFEISDEAAVTFTRRIYEGLADGVSLEEAVTAGRNELDEQYTVEALTPAIFLHNASSGLFIIQATKRAPSAEVDTLLGRAEAAAAAGRWEEAASYAYETLLVQPDALKAVDLYQRAELEEALDSALHHAVFHKHLRNWPEVLESCERYLSNSYAQNRPAGEREQVALIKANAYLQLAQEAEDANDWVCALRVYEKYSADSIFAACPESERGRITSLKHLAQAHLGFCDPWLRWRG
ncbi:MAG: CHAT domain-containing protein [Pyrinomonadaceae bacterium]